MTISIPISASASQVTDAMKQIQDAIARSGQAAKAFHDIDLSHPELSHLRTEIESVQRKFDDLSKVGRGATAAAVRAMKDGSSNFDINNWLPEAARRFPDTNERNRHTAQVGQHIFQGTRWQPQAPQQQPHTPIPMPAAPAPSGGGGGGGGGGAGLLGSVMGGLGGFAIASLAMAGISSVKQVIGSAIGKAQDEAIGGDTLMRHMGGNDLGGDFEKLRDTVRKTSEGLGLTYQETNRLSTAWAKLAGDMNDPFATGRDRTLNPIEGAKLGAGFARAYGMDPGEGGHILGQAASMGMDPGRFALMIGEAVNKGNNSGQAEQVSAALIRMAENNTRNLVTHSNSDETAAMYAGLNAMGVPGFRLGGAENVMGTLNASLSKGGNAGPASMALTYKALQAQGVTDPYDTQMLLEGGMFATPKRDLGYGSDTSVFEATMGEIRRQYAGQPQNRMLNAMENHFGTNMRQNRELLRYKPADLTTTQSALSGIQMDLKDINPSSYQDIVGIANASPERLETYRKQMLDRHGAGSLGDEEKGILREAGPGQLRDVLLQLSATKGQASTEGTETRNAMANLSNAMTQVGQPLLKPLNDLKDGLSDMGKAIGDLGGIISDVYKAAEGDPKAKQRLLSVGADGGIVEGRDAPLTDAAREERVRSLMAFYQSPEGGGWTKDQAAGLTANAGAESGYLAHGPSGDGGKARGLYQWHPDRVAAIEAHARAEGWQHTTLDTMDMMDQARAKAWELSADGPEAAAGAALRRTGSAYSAGYIETVRDQRPAAAELEGVRRGRRAERIRDLPPAPAAPAATIAPLEVIHRDTSGNVLDTQSLPVTTVLPPIPWGKDRAGASPTPPGRPEAKPEEPMRPPGGWGVKPLQPAAGINW